METIVHRVLFVLTGHDRLAAAGQPIAEPTGFHLSEAAHVWQRLVDTGMAVEFATPDGGRAPIDPSSKDLTDPINQRFLESHEVQAALRDSQALDAVDLARFDGLYFPGGHGTMWDLAGHSAVINAVEIMCAAAKPVAAVCHGPAALVNARGENGEWLVSGRRLAVFTDDEERATGKDSLMPFMLAERLASRGATLQTAENFAANVAIDGLLITGQNPASADGVGQALRDAVLKA